MRWLQHNAGFSRFAFIELPEVSADAALQQLLQGLEASALLERCVVAVVPDSVRRGQSSAPAWLRLPGRIAREQTATLPVQLAEIPALLLRVLEQPASGAW